MYTFNTIQILIYRTAIQTTFVYLQSNYFNIILKMCYCYPKHFEKHSITVASSQVYLSKMFNRITIFTLKHYKARKFSLCQKKKPLMREIIRNALCFTLCHSMNTFIIQQYRTLFIEQDFKQHLFMYYQITSTSKYQKYLMDIEIILEGIILLFPNGSRHASISFKQVLQNKNYVQTLQNTLVPSISKKKHFADALQRKCITHRYSQL